MTWTHIVIHHSATKDSRTLSMSAIRRYHRETNLWDRIGYQWVIEKVDEYYEILMGRPMDMQGAHAPQKRMNRRGIGVCFVGNYDIKPPPHDMLARGDELIEWLMDVYDIPPENIIGHREVGLMAGYDWKVGQFKSCPGALFDMDEFRGRY